MAQYRFFNYRENDSTDYFNRHLLNVLPAGLYTGFDAAAFGANMNLTLNHETTGLTQVSIDGVRTPKMGAIRTQQGVMIYEDAPVTVGITANSAGNPRIDTVIVEHLYEDEVVGGSVAIYKVIPGVKAAQPVPAALPFPERQMAIGYLFVPGGTSALNAGGVIYTRIDTPTLGNDKNVMLRNQPQDNIVRKQLLSVYGKANTATVNTLNRTLNLVAEGNHFVLNRVSDNYLEIDTIAAVYSANTYTIDILCRQRLKLRSRTVDGEKTGNIFVQQTGFNFDNERDGDVYIEEGETLRLIDQRAVFGAGEPFYFIVKGGEVNRQGLNKMNGELAFNRGTASLAGGEVTLDGMGNYYRLELLGNNEISWLPQRAPLRDGNDKNGAVIFVSVMVQPDPEDGDGIPTVVLAHERSGGPDGTLPIFTPSGNDYALFNGDVLMLIEEEGAWVLASIIGVNSDIRTLTDLYNAYIELTDATLAGLSTTLEAHIQAYNYQVTNIHNRIDNIVLGALSEARELTFNSLLEDAVILKGVEVSAYSGPLDGSGTVEISGGVVALVDDILEVPPYAGNYPIFLQRLGPGQGVWRTAPTARADDGVNYIRFAPFSSQRLEETVRRASYGLRDLRMSLSYNPDNFDSTGKGRFSEYGFALANGQNGTDNMTGMVPVGFNPNALRDAVNPADNTEPFNVNQGVEYRNINTVVGSKRHLLTVAEMPGHVHPINSAGQHSHVIGLSDNNNDGAEPRKGNGRNRTGNTDEAGLHTHTMQSVGGGQAHENRQYSRVTMFLQRIQVDPAGWQAGTDVVVDPGDGGGV